MRFASACSTEEALSARQHQDDQGPGEVLLQDDRGDDRYAGEQVRTEFALEQSTGEFHDEGNTAEREGGKKRNVERRGAENDLMDAQGVAHHQVNGDRRDREQSDEPLRGREHRHETTGATGVLHAASIREQATRVREQT
jgi:hypothetical protein